MRGVSEEPQEERDVMFPCCRMDVLWSFHSRSQSPGEGLEHCLYVPDRNGVWSCGEVLEERAWGTGLEGGQHPPQGTSWARGVGLDFVQPKGQDQDE